MRREMGIMENRIIENHLIELLPRTDRQRILAVCRPTQLVLSETLCQAGMAARYAYFPTQGFVSMVKTIAGASGLEVGMVGREGMVGIQLALGVKVEPLNAVVQGPGMAWRISAREFRVECAQSEPLRRILNRYVCVTMADLATSAACLRFHHIGARLARWLLMTQDRAHADTFNITHEFLSYMLGVRRVGVTTAASALQKTGLITYKRGRMTVLDREGLERAACGCYESNRLNYAGLLSGNVRSE